MHKLKVNCSFVKNCFPNNSMSINTTNYGFQAGGEILGKSMARDNTQCRDTISLYSKIGSMKIIPEKNSGPDSGKENLFSGRVLESEGYEVRQSQTPNKPTVLSSLSISMVDTQPQKNIFSHETPALRDLIKEKDVEYCPGENELNLGSNSTNDTRIEFMEFLYDLDPVLPFCRSIEILRKIIIEKSPLGKLNILIMTLRTIIDEIREFHSLLYREKEIKYDIDLEIMGYILKFVI